MPAEKRRKCICGCGRNVTAKTERTHLSGHTTPLVKAHNASRRLASLGMSPDRLRTRVLNLSPRRPRAKRFKRQLPTADPEVAPMDTDDLDNSAGASNDFEHLPQFMPDASAAQHQSPNSDRGLDADTDQMPIRAMPAPADSQLYNPESAADFRDATNGVREGVWSNKHRVTMEDEEEDDPDAAMYMDADLGAEDEGLEGEEDFWGDEDQYYDEYEELYGLPAGDLIDEEMERQLAQFGAGGAH
ncbi:hypothetical protein B0H13DRAFT_1853407 [Mycena leptocephala]|nr:hypothetical protein B0H13DRAFT_1853407 [Mycena leptocephala]